MRHITTALCLTFLVAAHAQPANDQCSAVTPVSLSIGTSVTRTGTRAGATTTNDGVPTSVLMNTSGVRTVWEAFTTTECSNVTVTFCGTALPATTMWNFITASCPADVPIYFSYANFGGFCPNGQFGLSWHNLPPGTYYVPIYCLASGGAYTMELNAVACIPGPANDECAGATPLQVNLGCEPTLSSVENATFSFAANECNGGLGNANDDVWFSFVATGVEHVILVDASAGTLDAVVELFAGECGTLGDLVACADATLDGENEILTATGLTAGHPYYIRVFDYYTALTLEPEFSICVTGDIPSAIGEAAGSTIQVRTVDGEGRFVLSGLRSGAALRALDAAGRVVLEDRISGTAHDVDLTAQCSGLYVLEVVHGNGNAERIKVVR